MGLFGTSTWTLHVTALSSTLKTGTLVKEKRDNDASVCFGKGSATKDATILGSPPFTLVRLQAGCTLLHSRDTFFPPVPSM